MKIWLLVGSGVCLFLALILMGIGFILIMMARKKGVPAVAVEAYPMAPPQVAVGNPDYAEPSSYTSNPDYAQPSAYTPPVYTPPAYTPPAYSPPATTGTAVQPLPQMVSDTQPPAASNLGVTEFVQLSDPARTIMSTEPVVAYGRLICTAGPLLGQRFELGPSGVVIGRERSIAQIVVEDPRVSKKHVWIGDRAGEVVAVDQGSTNGTFLNKPDSPRITEAVLHTGDVVIISDDVVRFEYDR